MKAMTTPFLPRLLLPLCALGLPAQQTTAEAIAKTQTALEKWVETRGLLSKEQRDWVAGREALQARMDVVRREIDSLRERIARAEQDIVEADKKRQALLAENEQRKGVTTVLTDLVAGLEQRTLALLPALPEPLRERVKVLSQRLPAAGETSKQSLGERWMNVIGVLNDIGKWNREVTVTSELRSLSDGSSVEVAVLYAGIGQGWYAATNGKVAGVGTVVGGTWQWQPANELAAPILQAIAVWKNEQVAAFVRLPVRIQ